MKTAIRIATWNVNSVRRRLDHVAWLAEAVRPDLLCLQETKVSDPQFPAEDLRGLGFPHVAYRGEKGYNGVAVLSRLPLADTASEDWGGRQEARHLSVRFQPVPEAERVHLHNLYVPAGGDKPDPMVNPKFAYKLDYLAGLANHWAARPDTAAGQALLVGDFNIAPLETDVWSHTHMRRIVSHTEIEIAHLERVRTAGRWIDAVRHVIPETEHLYSWWSYRAADWEKSNRGLRLDHIWITPPLLVHLKNAFVYRDARNWNQPSDHAPVCVDLEF